MARTSSKILNIGNKSWHLYLIPNLKRKVFTILPSCMMFTVIFCNSLFACIYISLTIHMVGLLDRQHAFLSYNRLKQIVTSITCLTLCHCSMCNVNLM